MTAREAGVRRGEALAAIVDAIDAVTCSHPVRVAIDGPAAAGKTTLADELAVALRCRGRDAIRASIEGFLRPRIERYKRGAGSSRGCYEDSFDFERLLLELLRRARIRDAEVFGSPDAAERRHRARYLPAQQHYLRTVGPGELADIVLENDDPSHPGVFVRR